MFRKCKLRVTDLQISSGVVILSKRSLRGEEPALSEAEEIRANRARDAAVFHRILSPL